MPESQNVACQNRTMLGNDSPCESRRIAECLEIKIVSAVNQICRFASTKKKKKAYRKLTVACQRHPTELEIVNDIAKIAVVTAGYIYIITHEECKPQ